MADKTRTSSVADTLQPADGQAEIPVVVAVHIRPLVHDEVVNGCTPCLSVTEGEPQVCCGHHTFSFDQVYGGGGMAPTNIFSDCVEPLVQGVFKGYNATVLAYGQTGSGKTYTMGSQFTPHERPSGVIPDVLVSMFDRIFSTPDIQYTLRVGFIEIHKEEIHDLLLERVQEQPTISLREMPNGSMCIAGAKEIEVDLSAGADASLMFVMNILMRGSMARATSMTMMNARSSRSHAVFSLTLEQRRDLSGTGEDDADSIAGGNGAGAEGGGEVAAGKSGDEKDLDMTYLCAKMLLVDLAGSERAKRTQATGARLQEGIHINQGLLSLANVIQALVDGHKHVPYRNSKLTRLLQDSLGHNSRTVMVACVSPADSNMEETINTLRYANRARNIKNKPVVNRDPSAAQIVLLRQQLAAARAEVEVLRGQLHGMQRNTAAGPGASGTPDRSSYGVDPATLASAEGKKELAHALAEQEAALITSKGSGEDQSKALVEQLERYQCRILELEEQATQHAQQEGTTAEPASTGTAPAYGSPAAVPPLPNAQAVARATPPGSAKTSPTKDPQQSVRMMQRLSTLQDDMKRKQDQIAKLAAMEMSGNGVRAQYDRLVADLIKEQDALKTKHSELHKRLKEVDNQHAAEKIKQSKTYKKQVKDLNEQLALMKKKETEKIKLEGLMRKSEEMINRLKSDVNKIKGQKAGIAKQMSELQQDYDSFKRGKAKEIISLKKDSRRAETEMRRLALLNQKQKSVLQRKIQEAEEAKKRLQTLKHRSAKRTTTATASGSAAVPPRPSSVMSSRGGTSHPAFTPFGASTGSGGGNGGGGGSTGGGGAASAAGDAGPSVTPASDGRDPKDWLREEIEAASTAHYTRVVMQGTIAKRGDLSKRVKEYERKVAEIDHMPPEMQKQQETTRAGLMASIKYMEEDIDQCTQSISALHSDLDAAGKQNDEAREDSTAERFAAVSDVTQARTMLSTLFRMACAYNDEANIVKVSNSDLDDANEELKDRCEAALAEAEALHTELAEAQAAARSAQEALAAAQAAAAATASPGRSPGRREAPAAPAVEVSPGRSSPGRTSPGRDSQRRSKHLSAATGVSPGRRPPRHDGVMARGNGGPSSGGGSVASDDGSSSREMELGTMGVIGTFDDMTPRGAVPATLPQMSPPVGTMPSIEEERAAPDNKSLDAQFQELMQEIQINLKARSRNSSPEPRPRSSSAATSSTYHDSRGSSLRVSADPSAQPSFRADPSSLWQPGEEAQPPYHERTPSRSRHSRPHSSSAVNLAGLPQQPPPLPRASDLRASAEAPAAAGEPEHVHRYSDEPPASVGGGGRSAMDIPQLPLSPEAAAVAAASTGSEAPRHPRARRFKTSASQIVTAPAVSSPGLGDTHASYVAVDGPEGLVPPPHLPPPTGPPRPRSANGAHVTRSFEHEFPVLPPAPGPPPFAPLPLGSDPPARPMARSRSIKSNYATSQDVFHNISNIDSARSTGSGGGGGGSTHATASAGKSVMEGKGGKVTSFGIGPTIGHQGSGRGGASHRSDGSAVLSRVSAGTGSGPRTTLSNTQNGYTHAPRPPSSTGTLRAAGNVVGEGGGSLVLTPESHPLAGPLFGAAGDAQGWRDDRGEVVMVPRGNGIGRNRVARAPLEDPLRGHHSALELELGDMERHSGTGSSMDEGPKTPATNVRGVRLAAPSPDGVIGRGPSGVQAKNMYKEAVAARSQAARVLTTKSHLPPQ
eukprot:jgi/Ulvmu1/1158/UM107_0032.1